MEKPIRVIDGGGQGFRRADVFAIEVKNLTPTGRVQSVDELLNFVCADLPNETEGIAYAMAGEIRDQNIVVKSPQIHLLDGVALGALTSAKTKKPVFVFNDMDGAVAGMAELLPELRYFMGITISSGIGLRIWTNGKILALSEGGHIPLDPSPFAPLCGCDLRGCAESICGGESVKRRVVAETQALDIQIPEGTHPCRFLDESFDKKEDWALRIYDLVALGLGRFFAIYQTILRLPAVVWKGKFALHAFPRIEQLIRYYMRKNLINPDWEKEMRFVASPDPEKDSLIGAAALFRQAYN